VSESRQRLEKVRPSGDWDGSDEDVSPGQTDELALYPQTKKRGSRRGAEALRWERNGDVLRDVPIDPARDEAVVGAGCAGWVWHPCRDASGILVRVDLRFNSGPPTIPEGFEPVAGG